MAKETRAALQARARRVVKALFAAHPDARCALSHGNAYELAVATILSAQCTDKMVNTVTPRLLARYPDPARLAAARAREVEAIIRPTGFYRNKTKSLLGMARAVVANHGGEIPDTIERLVALPGVGRKTANVILGNAFGVPGMVVDTHVGRIARRLALTRHLDPEKVEGDLMQLIPRHHWTQVSHALIFHGRRVCSARKPRCEECPLNKDCPHPSPLRPARR